MCVVVLCVCVAVAFLVFGLCLQVPGASSCVLLRPLASSCVLFTVAVRRSVASASADFVPELVVYMSSV